RRPRARPFPGRETRTMAEKRYSLDEVIRNELADIADRREEPNLETPNDALKVALARATAAAQARMDKLEEEDRAGKRTKEEQEQSARRAFDETWRKEYRKVLLGAEQAEALTAPPEAPPEPIPAPAAETPKDAPPPPEPPRAVRQRALLETV